MKLSQQTTEWIEKAIEIAPHGKITLHMQDGKIMKILTESKKEIKEKKRL